MRVYVQTCVYVSVQAGVCSVHTHAILLTHGYNLKACSCAARAINVSTAKICTYIFGHVCAQTHVCVHMCSQYTVVMCTCLGVPCAVSGCAYMYVFVCTVFMLHCACVYPCTCVRVCLCAVCGHVYTCPCARMCTMLSVCVYARAFGVCVWTEQWLCIVSHAQGPASTG